MANRIPTPATDSSMTEVLQIFVSAGHDYWTKDVVGSGSIARSTGILASPTSRSPYGIEELTEVQCLAGQGLRGDRYAAGRANRKGQITFISVEAIDEIRAEFQLPDLLASVFRRNVVVRGVKLSELLDRQFKIQGVEFEGSQECKPCHWMERVVAPGAKNFMQEKFRGGLRAKILCDGILRTSVGETR